MSLFHSCFSNILLVKTNYLVYPYMEHWSKMGEVFVEYISFTFYVKYIWKKYCKNFLGAFFCAPIPFKWYQKTSRCGTAVVPHLVHTGLKNTSNLGQKLLIQKAHHSSLESAHLEVTKNLYYALSTSQSQILIFLGSSSWTIKQMELLFLPLFKVFSTPYYM